MSQTSAPSPTGASVQTFTIPTRYLKIEPPNCLAVILHLLGGEQTVLAEIINECIDDFVRAVFDVRLREVSLVVG